MEESGLSHSAQETHTAGDEGEWLLNWCAAQGADDRRSSSCGASAQALHGLNASNINAAARWVEEGGHVCDGQMAADDALGASGSVHAVAPLLAAPSMACAKNMH